MKGSAFKLGNVATKSALKQKASPAKDIKWVGFPKEHDPNSKSKLAHNRKHEMDPKWDHSKKEEKKKETKAQDYHTGPKMKSPAKQKRVSKKGTNIDKLMDKATKFEGTKTFTPKSTLNEKKLMRKDLKKLKR